MTKEKLNYKTLKDLIRGLEEQAQELINFGNSKEKAEGYGIQKATTTIYEYCEKNKIILWK